MKARHAISGALRPIALGAALAVTGAAASAQEAEGKATDLMMVTGTPTGTWFPTGAAFAEFADEAMGGQPVSVTPGAGSIGNIMSVGSGQADLGLSYGAFLKLAQEGGNEINPGEPMPDLRAVLALTPNVLHVLKAEDAPFESLEDLAATEDRVAVGTGVVGSTEDFGLSRLLEMHGAGYDAIEEKGGSVTRGVTQGRNEGWQNRQLDLVSYMFTAGSPQIEQLLNQRDGEVVSLSQEMQQTFVEELGFAPITIPAGTYPGQEEDIVTVGLPMTLFSTTDVSADVIHAITKGTAENMDRLHQVSASYEEVVPEELMENTGIELHEGAQRYYREQGWIE